jgi:hypothetical protein
MRRLNPAALGQVADRLTAVGGLPQPVVAARTAVIELRTMQPPPLADEVGPARARAIRELVAQASTGKPVDWSRLDPASVMEARRRVEAAKELASIVSGSRETAAAALLASLVEHQAQVVTAIQAEHHRQAVDLWELFEGKGGLDVIARDQAARDLVGCMEVLRQLVLDLGPTTAAKTSITLDWVRSDRLRPWARTQERYGKPGTVEFWRSLFADGCTVDEVWCPTAPQNAERDAALHEQTRHDRLPETTGGGRRM